VPPAISPELLAPSALVSTAASIALLHTLIGIDHSLPFVVLGRSRGWSLRRTLAITALCGLAHVLSSIALGAVGIGLGVAIGKLEWIESTRGGWAAWLLIGFGGAYAVHSLLRNARGRVHSHRHSHGHKHGHGYEHGYEHEHEHDHQHAEHRHPHEAQHGAPTAWALFLIFAFGPCEPLIPLLMAPAALHHAGWVAAVAGVFGVVTLLTMLLTVSAGYLGLSKLRLGALERHADTFAGVAIASSGLAIQVLGI